LVSPLPSVAQNSPMCPSRWHLSSKMPIDLPPACLA
jgi:hypothetical protein